jgi:hypothetical protein
VKRAAKEIESRENALQSYLKGKKLRMDEIYKDPDNSDRVF